MHLLLFFLQPENNKRDKKTKRLFSASLPARCKRLPQIQPCFTKRFHTARNGNYGVKSLFIGIAPYR